MSETQGPTAHAVDAMQRMLAISIETSGARACLIEPVAGRHRLAGWLSLARSGDVTMLAHATETCRRLERQLGCVLWDEELGGPFSRTISPVHFPPVQQVGVTLSARPPMRVLLVGLTSGLSLSAAMTALACTPSTVIAALPLDSKLDHAQLTHFLSQSPDVVVLVGGFDEKREEAQVSVLRLCRVVAQAIGRLPRTQRPPLIYAANRLALERAETQLRASDGPLMVEVVENVLPAPGDLQASGLARALTYLYWRLNQRIIGFRELSRWPTSPGQPTTVEAMFIQLVQAWALQKELAELHAVYVAPQWRVHVWVNRERPGAWVRYVEPHAPLPESASWPPIQLVSGAWPFSMPLSTVRWRDQAGLAPTVASLGQVAPQAMWDVMEKDILVADPT